MSGGASGPRLLRGLDGHLERDASQGVDVPVRGLVDCATVEQVARLSTTGGELQMVHMNLVSPRTAAPIFGAVDGRGVPTSR
jgi:hypothetical protein